MTLTEEMLYVGASDLPGAVAEGFVAACNVDTSSHPEPCEDPTTPTRRPTGSEHPGAGQEQRQPREPHDDERGDADPRRRPEHEPFE
jgi:hypothetical protein